MLGTTLDNGMGAKRWERWRPTVALCQHEDLVVDRLELLHQRNATALADLVRRDITQVSPETDVRTHVVDVTNAWALDEVYEALHAFARGYDFDPEREDYLIHITTGTHIAQISMFLLAESRDLPARLIQTSPRGNGPGTYAIIDLDLSKYDRIASRFQREQRDSLASLKSGIDTRNAAFNKLVERIEQVCTSTRDPLLLTGPTGSGKSQLAGRIFALKQARQRVEGEFVEVNCATIRGDGAMSTLFGHSKGAFTGAVGERPGMLRKAHRGVLFLDEIGELGLEEQAMLLRAVEHGSFYPVGSDREVKSDFQLIAGTNRDLVAEVTSGGFRDDLLARINVWTFRLPGLRERSEDIEPNLDYELERLGRQMNLRLTFSREARDQFLAFASSPDAIWPGNFRDFGAAVRRMATLAPGGRIGVDQVEEELARLFAGWIAAPSPAPPPPPPPTVDLADRPDSGIDLFDRVQLEAVLQVCVESPSLSAAGRRLFSVSRLEKKTANDADRLRKYLAKFGLSWDDVQRSTRSVP
jgi:transcriptional regulatory protein RtcR